MERKLKIFDLLGKFNFLEERLLDFQCRSCYYRSGSSLPSDYLLLVRNVTNEVSVLVGLARDFLAHLPGLEDKDCDDIPVTWRCLCFGRLIGRLELVARELEGLFGTFPRAYGLSTLYIQKEDNDDDDSESSWYCGTPTAEEKERLHEERIKLLKQEIKLASNCFEETCKSAYQHIDFISHHLRKCAKQHRFLASHVLYDRKSCKHCCNNHTG
jgi:hypothetical protein